MLRLAENRTEKGRYQPKTIGEVDYCSVMLSLETDLDPPFGVLAARTSSNEDRRGLERSGERRGERCEVWRGERCEEVRGVGR